VATTLKPPHTSTYPRRRIPAGPTIRLPPFRRVVRANSRTRGVAEGTIMATIMTHHIAKSRRNWTASQSCIVGIAIPGAVSLTAIASAAAILDAMEKR
jgi:hypothetical protein